MNRWDAGEPPAFNVLEGGSGGSDDDFELGATAGFEAGLDDAVARMDRALRMTEAGGDAVSFDLSTPDPERELLDAMRAMREEVVSFSIEGGEPGGLEAGTKISRFLNRVMERVGLATSVETRLDGRPVASTAVGLTGNFTCALAEVIGQSDLEAHVKSLETKLRARRAWMRFVLSTGQMAVKLALATGAGNPLLALPAALRFMRGVLAEWTQLERAA